MDASIAFAPAAWEINGSGDQNGPARGQATSTTCWTVGAATESPRILLKAIHLREQLVEVCPRSSLPPAIPRRADGNRSPHQ